MRQTILVFGGVATLLLVLFRVSRYVVLSDDIRAELTIGVTAIVFLLLGLLIRRRGNDAAREPVVTQPSPLGSNPATALTGREHEVLVHIAAGMSNREIAATLHLSESTVKTHVSNLLSKLDARRRTQAVRRAREQGLLG